MDEESAAPRPGKESILMNAESRPKTIAVATDFSDNAEVATTWATEIARRHAAKLVLLHAILPETPPVPEFVVLPPTYYEAIRESVQQRLDERVAELRKSGLVADAEVVFGPAASALLAAAKQCGADLLVAGTRGRTGWKRVLLGSTAAHLVRDAHCPVLTIHPTDAGPPRPVRKVLVATDFSEAARRAALAAIALASPEVPLALRVFHVYRLPNEALHLPARVLADAIRDAREAALARVDEEAQKLARPGVTVASMAREGYPPELILEEARRLDADLIALGTQGRSGLDRLFLGSTAERVLPAAPCPVLTVRHADGA